MRRLLVTLAALLALSGCQAGTYVVKALAPLEDEGEVYLYFQPFAQEADRLKFTVEEVSAIRDDGKEFPLSLSLAEIKGQQIKRQRLFASGRLQPGRYKGFAVKVKSAALAGEEGEAQLLTPKEPQGMDAPFVVRSKKAAVFLLTFKYPESVGESFKFKPVFSVTLPEKPITKLVGYASNTASDSLTVFDRFKRQVVGVIPVGRGPMGMALDQTLNRAYIALNGDDAVDVIDVAAGEPLSRIRLGVGDNPRELALTPDNRLLLAVNAGSYTVSFIDPVSFVELNRVGTGQDPVSILMDRDGKRAYVFNSRSNSITVIDVANRTVAGTIPTEAQPLRGQLNRAGDRLYVIHGGSAYMLVVSIPSFTVVNRIYLGIGMASIKVDPNTDLIYVGMQDETRVLVYDPFSFIPVDSIDVDGAPSYMAIDGEQNNLLLVMPETGTVSAVNLDNRKNLSVFDVGQGPYFVTLMGERY